MGALETYTLSVFILAFLIGTRFNAYLPTKVFESFKVRSFENHTCSICLQSVKAGTYASALQCGHIFHKRCITRWITKGQSCPMCRAQITCMNLCHA